MHKSLRELGASFVLVMMICACGGVEPRGTVTAATQGGEGNQCFPNDTCLSGLACRSGYCVSEPFSGGGDFSDAAAARYGACRGGWWRNDRDGPRPGHAATSATTNADRHHFLPRGDERYLRDACVYRFDARHRCHHRTEHAEHDNHDDAARLWGGALGVSDSGLLARCAGSSSVGMGLGAGCMGGIRGLARRGEHDRHAFSRLRDERSVCGLGKQ